MNDHFFNLGDWDEQIRLQNSDVCQTLDCQTNFPFHLENNGGCYNKVRGH